MLQEAKMTPMMQQYLSIKQAHHDCLLFYRLGDFYELFFDDAVIAAQTLEIALTKRGQHLNEDIPMCGVPAHASDHYIEKLVKAGYRVAICEQLESPQEAKKRGNKSVVRREVIRIITSGTIAEDPMLSAKNANYLATIAIHDGKLGLAWAEITTGECSFTTITSIALTAELARLQPSEVIVSEKLLQDDVIKSSLQDYRSRIVIRADNLFVPSRAESILCDFYGLQSLAGIAPMQKQEISANGALIDYIKHTHKTNLPRLTLPKMVSQNHFMMIDAATRRNLEIDISQAGTKQGSLRWILDKTSTSGGGRLLGYYLSSPLTDSNAINNRLESVECFYNQDELRAHLIHQLKQFPDIERALARVFMNRGSPRDLANIRDGLQISAKISHLLLQLGDSISPDIKSQLSQMCEFTDLVSLLESALLDDAPYNLKDGGFIRPQFDPQLDHLRDLRDNTDLNLNSMQSKYRQLTGVSNLKITKNNIIGYYIEVPTNQSAKLQEPQFIHRQSLGTSARFTSEELRIMETEILSCNQKITSLELSIFEEISTAVRASSEQISLVAQAISLIDVIITFAQIAKERRYVKPQVHNGLDFIIKEGKHPIVSHSIGDKFITNDSSLTESDHTWLLTGPNMAGKSTFLRQNALICIMAQIGSFVPAKSASIGVVDRLFSRIGAGDDISRGQSTFMVEMSETAAILNNASNRSLVILDEIGRGTSTFDGLSIAWSVIEYIHLQLSCRTLFATHYHELSELENHLTELSCHTMQVQEWKDKVIFMHKVILGKADRSYGIHVAELAGVPLSVSRRAKEVLRTLEAEKHSNLNIDNMPAITTHDAKVEEMVAIIKECDIDTLTPRSAFDILYQLKSKVIQ